MYSFMARLNALATFGVFGLMLLTTMASLTDYLHKPSPEVSLSLRGVDRLHRLEDGSNEALLSMGLNANMSSVFSWNTKQIFLFLQAEYESEGSTRNQVSLWDRIIERPEDAVLNLPHVRNKYRLIDKGADLRGRAFNLTLTWNVMNKVGGTYFDSVTSSGHTLPTEYDAAPGAPRQRGGGMGARARRGHAGVRI